MRARTATLKFSIGARVSFYTDDFRRSTETLVRYNKKSVTVLTDDGHRWTASPSFLRPFEPKDIRPAGEGLPDRRPNPK